MPKKSDSFAALMTVAQDQQSYFTTKAPCKNNFRFLPAPFGTN